MRTWSTDGRIERDTRYPAWLRWAWRQAWLPMRVVGFLHDLYVRAVR